MLYRTLKASAARIAAGEPIVRVMSEGFMAIEEAGFAVDYYEARHAETLRRVESLADGPLRLLVAARIGKTRLIDNIAVRGRDGVDHRVARGRLISNARDHGWLDCRLPAFDQAPGADR